MKTRSLAALFFYDSQKDKMHYPGEPEQSEQLGGLYMAVTVSLKKVLEALELLTDESSAYVDIETGEVISISGEYMGNAGDEDLDTEELRDWAIAAIEQAREIADSPDRFLPLPDKFDIHEWDIMRRFAESRPNSRQRNELMEAIHGSGAFRFFKSAIGRFGVEEEWYSYRESVMEAIAKEWLEEHGLTYK
jgi:hypothetical protein